MISITTKTARQLCCLMIASMFSTFTAVAQSVSVTSTTGYTVHVTVTPTAIVAPSTCPSGYNYNLTYNYDISFSGTNIPSLGLYTLQGFFTCGSSTFFFNVPNTAGTGTLTTTSTPYNPGTTCATATPATLGCLNGYTLEVEGPGIAAQTISVPGLTPVNPLAISLKSFDGRMDGKNVFLTWTTLTETNNTSFILERSADAKNWNTLTTVAGSGTSTDERTYKYTDISPVPGMNYYRLKDVSKDGQISVSKTIAAKIFSLGTDVSIYPNPLRDNRIRVIGLETPSEWNISVTNATSQLLYTGAITDASIALPSMPAGMYFVRLSNGKTNESKVFKLIKE